MWQGSIWKTIIYYLNLPELDWSTCTGCASDGIMKDGCGNAVGGTPSGPVDP